jgi:histone acetyltransferase (RNA polymerase elongator complex component)
MKNKTHMIVPVFIPHMGCPYRCVFCNQTDITGKQGRVDVKMLQDTLATYLGNTPLQQLPPNREVAFYGGSFTGLPAERQEGLLEGVQPWLRKGLVNSIRLSTHPLYIDEDRLVLLKKYGVRTIELGIQSTDPNVQDLSGRPCSWEVMKTAAGRIKENGFRLGLQLMPGLPGDTDQTFAKSVQDVISFKPDFTRLYPTLVVRHTELFEMYKEGKYTPWSLERTVENLTRAVKIFRAKNIPVIRLGLHPDPSLLKNYVAGPYHPSLRYLVDCRIGLEEMIDNIRNQKNLNGQVKFKVPSNRVSVYIGHKRENIQKLKTLFHLDNVLLQPEKICDRLQLIA